MSKNLGNCKTCGEELKTICTGYYRRFNMKTKRFENTKEWDNGHPDECCDCFDEAMGKPKKR